VIAARDRQTRRYGAERFSVNARLGVRGLARHCRLDERGAHMLDCAAERLALSARAHDRVLKVARTIADLAGSDAIHAEHVAEALQFRWVERATR
jgi:magnesium chelatase family protein